MAVSGGIGPIQNQDKNNEKRGMVNWFTMVLFDVEIRLKIIG
jgi:hypothetical protein